MPAREVDEQGTFGRMRRPNSRCRNRSLLLNPFDAGQFGTYTLFQKNGQDVAGMMNPTPDTPGEGCYWHSYIAVEDVEECAKQAPLIGGRVVVPPHDVPDVGRVCAVADPTGAIAHLMQPLKQ